MDFILDILILKEDINKINLTESTFEWGGETISEKPRKYSNNLNIFLQEYDDKQYYESFIENSFDYKKYIALHLIGNQLVELAQIVNNNSDELETNEIVTFLNEVIKLKSYLILLIRDEEIIDKKFKGLDEEQLKDALIKSLNYLNPIGALITNN